MSNWTQNSLIGKYTAPCFFLQACLQNSNNNKNKDPYGVFCMQIKEGFQSKKKLSTYN